jgi:hypothetical protein
LINGKWNKGNFSNESVSTCISLVGEENETLAVQRDPVLMIREANKRRNGEKTKGRWHTMSLTCGKYMN